MNILIVGRQNGIYQTTWFQNLNEKTKVTEVSSPEQALVYFETGSWDIIVLDLEDFEPILQKIRRSCFRGTLLGVSASDKIRRAMIFGGCCHDVLPEHMPHTLRRVENEVYRRNHRIIIPLKKATAKPEKVCSTFSKETTQYIPP